MAVTTTGSIGPQGFLCGACGLEAPGGLMVGDRCIDCVESEGDRAILKSLIGGAKRTPVVVPVLRRQTLRPNPSVDGIDETVDDIEAGSQDKEARLKSWIGGKSMSAAALNAPALPVGGMVPIGSRKARR